MPYPGFEKVAWETFVAGRIGMLHIDGNHDADKVMWDVQSWLAKVGKGGCVILDDINWPSVAPAWEWLKGSMRMTRWQDHQTWGVVWL